MPCQTALLWLHVSPPVPLTTAQLHPVRCGLHSAFLGFVTGFKLFFVPDVPRVRASNAALDGRKSRTGRRSSGIRHRSLRAIHTTHCHSRSIALNTLRGSANTISYIFGPASPI